MWGWRTKKKSHGRSDYWYGWRMCASFPRSPWKGYWVPNDNNVHRNSQNVNLSWVGFVYSLLLRNDLRGQGDEAGDDIIVFLFCPYTPQAWEGITNKYCNIYFVIPIHWGRKFIFSSVMGSGKVISSLAFVSEAFEPCMGVFCTVSASHPPWVRVGVNGDRVWISSMEQSGNIKMIYLYWNYLTLLILIWPINNINVNNREDLIPPNPHAGKVVPMDPRRLLFTEVVVPPALKRSKQRWSVFWESSLSTSNIRDTTVSNPYSPSTGWVGMNSIGWGQSIYHLTKGNRLANLFLC